MMLSKMTWIAFFGALCFRISESVLSSDPVTCHADIQFKNEIEKYKSTSVPVLITKVGFINEDQNIIKLLDRSLKIYPKLIIVLAGPNNCLVTDAHFPSGARYPALFMVRNDQMFNEAYHWSSAASIESFLTRAENATLDGDGTGVTEAIDKGIVDRANAALAAAAARASAARASSSSSSADNWSQPPYPGLAVAAAASGHPSGFTQTAWSSNAVGGPSGAHQAAGPSGAHQAAGLSGAHQAAGPSGARQAAGPSGTRQAAGPSRARHAPYLLRRGQSSTGNSRTRTGSSSGSNSPAVMAEFDDRRTQQRPPGGRGRG